jgi:hypothetical protein
MVEGMQPVIILLEISKSFNIVKFPKLPGMELVIPFLERSKASSLIKFPMLQMEVMISLFVTLNDFNLARFPMLGGMEPAISLNGRGHGAFSRMTHHFYCIGLRDDLFSQCTGS